MVEGEAMRNYDEELQSDDLCFVYADGVLTIKESPEIDGFLELHLHEEQILDLLAFVKRWIA